MKPENVTYFDVNVCVPLFDSEYPHIARTLNRWLEVHSGRWSPSWVHTAFILKARRDVNACHCRVDPQTDIGSPIFDLSRVEAAGQGKFQNQLSR